MTNESQSRQLELFSVVFVSWETLPEDCQTSVQELLSLLIEQSLNHQLQRTETTQQENNQHV